MGAEPAPMRLSDAPIHLGLGATAIPEPPFTGDMSWYEAYGERHEADGSDGRLISEHSFSSSWDMWEMHPLGSEVVLVVDGSMTLVQELDGGEQHTTLHAGEYAINEPGTWHTADVVGACRAVFVTAGLGTEHRPR